MKSPLSLVFPFVNLLWLFPVFTSEKGDQRKDDRDGWNADIDEFHETILDGIILVGIILDEPDARTIFRSPGPFDASHGFW